MEKIDYKKKFKEFYTAKATNPVLVNVPKLNYLCIDGEGDPNKSIHFSTAIETMFGLSYTIKFNCKKSIGVDYGVMPLEGLWWCNDMEQFSVDKKEDWKWTLMIMQPEIVTNKIFEDSLADIKSRKKLESINNVRFESIHEGLSSQILHIGPYANEQPTIEKLHNYIKENDYMRSGKHREIYLSDMRRTAPEKLKTIIRQPIQKL